MTTYMTDDILRQLDQLDLYEILEKVAAVQRGNLCTVQFEENNNRPRLYGIWENSPDWVECYYNSGGVWRYHSPEYYLQMIEAELRRRGLYATNVRTNVSLA